MIRSLRYRLLVSASICSAVVLALLGWSIYAAMRHSLMSDFDASLLVEARVLEGMISQDGAKVSLEFDPQQMPDFLAEGQKHFFELWRDDGRVLARSPSLGSLQLKRDPTLSVGINDIDLPDGQRGRAATIIYTPRPDEQDENRPPLPGRPVSILIAAEPFEVYHTLKLLAWLLAVLCAAALIAMGAVLLRVVGRGLRPVKNLAGQIDSLRETDLSRRFPHDGVPTELLPVVDKLNGLLVRLEAAFTREKSFTADVAHELRTPLAGLRATLEVSRSQPRAVSAYENALDDCRGITDRMEAMVKSLLMLARSDAHQITVERENVDISLIVAETWCQFQYRADRLGLQVALEMPDPCPARTDPEKFRIVLHNVFDNALSYVNPAGHMRIAVRQTGHAVVVEIANTGSQIAADDVPRLFERFWRGDKARPSGDAHCGLGLSLSQRLMHLLGAEISIQSALGDQFIVYLKIPELKPAH